MTDPKEIKTWPLWEISLTTQHRTDDPGVTSIEIENESFKEWAEEQNRRFEAYLLYLHEKALREKDE